MRMCVLEIHVCMSSLFSKCTTAPTVHAHDIQYIQLPKTLVLVSTCMRGVAIRPVRSGAPLEKRMTGLDLIQTGCGNWPNHTQAPRTRAAHQYSQIWGRGVERHRHGFVRQDDAVLRLPIKVRRPAVATHCLPPPHTDALSM